MSEIINNISGVYPSVVHLAPSLGVAPRVSSTRIPHGAYADASPPTTFRPVLRSALEVSSFRAARTQAIRSEIANGTFETPERIQGTAERLLDVIA